MLKISDELLNKDMAVESFIDPVPVGLSGYSQLYDQRTVDIVGVANIKHIAEKLLDPVELEHLMKIPNEHSEHCLEFLMALDYEKHKNFLNHVQWVSFLCSNDCAEKLEAMEAAPAEDNVVSMVMHALFNNREKFDQVLNSVRQTQDTPEKSYSIFPRTNGTNVVTDITPEMLDVFRERVLPLCEERKFGQLCRVGKIKDANRLGVSVEHGSKKAGQALVDDDASPISAAWRFRNTDFIFIDKSTQLLWVNSKIFSKGTKDKLLKAVGELFCGDERAFLVPLSINFELFNTVAFVDRLKQVSIPGVKLLEVRSLRYSKEGFSRNSNIIMGPLMRGCLTETTDWKVGLPERWRTTLLEITYETSDGVRETIVISKKSIRLGCTENFSLAVALLKKLHIIPNNDN